MNGDSNINLDGTDMIVKSVHYKGTFELYNLLFKNQTISCNKKYNEAYLDILTRTNSLYSRHNLKLRLMCTTKEVKANYQNITETGVGRTRSSSVPCIQTLSKT